MSTANKEIKNVVLYDFMNPSKFSREQLKALEAIAEKYCGALTNQLTSKLGTITLVEMKEVKAMLYQEYLEQEDKITGVMEVNPLKRAMLLQLDMELGDVILDLLFGGIGESLNERTVYSDIEKMLLKELMGEWMTVLSDMMDEIFRKCDSDIIVNKVSESLQLSQVIPPGETVVSVTISVAIGNTVKQLYLCIPYMTIESIKDQLNMRQFLSSQQQQVVEVSDLMSKRIERSIVEVKAELGNITISVEDFLQLSVGDMIQMDQESDDSINIYVKNTLKYKANIENQNNKVTTRISEIIIGEE